MPTPRPGDVLSRFIMQSPLLLPGRPVPSTSRSFTPSDGSGNSIILQPPSPLPSSGRPESHTLQGWEILPIKSWSAQRVTHRMHQLP